MKLAATRAAATAAVVGGGLVLAATAASAATSAGATASGSSWSTVPASYTCSMNGFGQNLPALTIPATINVQNGVATGTTVTIKVVTTATPMPSALAAAFPGLTGFGINGNAAFTGTWTGNTTLNGNTTLTAAPGALTQFPSLTALGTFNPTGVGQAFAAAPTTITITVNTAAGATTMAPFNCTLVNPATAAFNLLGAGATGTGTGTTTGTGTGAQSFTCTITNAGAAANTMNLGMNLGFNQLNLGTMGNVWMAGNGFVNQLGMGNLTMLSGSGSLAWSGAGANGTIPLNAKLNGGNLVLGGQFMPRHVGMTKLTAAQRFQLRMRQMQTGNTVVVVCTNTAPASTMANVGAADMNSAAAQGVAAGEGTGVNAGAPNTGTGGSLHGSSDTGLLAGGGAALLAGIGIVLYAMRRRSRTAGL